MRILGEKKIAALKEQFPVGCRVRLVKMEDPQAPPVGTEGIVSYIDDIGTIHVRWKTGSSLGVVFGEDIIERI